MKVEKAHAVLSASAWKNLKTDVIQKTKTISSRFTTTRKLTWVLKDSAKFNVLIETLKKHNDSLHLLCPEFAFELLLINLALEYLPRHEGSDLKQLQQLFSSSQVKPLGAAGGSVRDGGEANTEASMEAGAVAVGEETEEILPLVSPSQQGLQVVADLANIKIEAASSSKEEELSLEKEKELLSFKEDDLDTGRFCMAVWLSGRETVYVERHSYKANGDTLSQQIRTNILKLGRLLKLPVCAKRLHTLELLGLVEFPELEAVGFVYRLPFSLGQHKKGFPIEDMNIRKPRATLFQWEDDPVPALGLRFDLARKLVQSVSFLHASGWLHKNIRTDELYIFPKSGPELSRDWKSMDFKNPFLLGYRYSRPDVVRDRRQHRPNQPKVQDDVQSPLPSGAPILAASEVLMSIQEGQASLEQASQDRATPSTSKAQQQKLQERHVRFVREDSVDSDSSSDLNAAVPEKRKLSQQAHRVNLDMKHHPFKRAYPDRRYCHAFDVYSLGVALLEIGMWTSVEELYAENDDDLVDPFDTRRELIDIAQRLLDRCGERYTKVTISCLSVDPEDSEESLAEQRELCARTAADLAQCQV
jgi:hypothetical protein